MPHRVSVIAGDGIGPEVVGAARRVLDATGVELAWDEVLIGQPALDGGASDAVPSETVESIRTNRVALKGPVTTHRRGGFRSPNVVLRQALDLYVQVRLIKSFPRPAAPSSAVDLAVIRETTEDLYAGIEFVAGSTAAVELVDWLAAHDAPVAVGSGISIKAISPAAVERAMRFALDWARRNERRRITVVHKATAIRATDGLFLQVAEETARKNPAVPVDDALVDDVAMRLARRPHAFDVLVTSNLYGDILADLGAGLIGSPGLVPGANYGADSAVFEPAHGSAPKYAGQDRANPIATILSGALMLRHLDEGDAASRIERAVTDVVADGRCLTYDLAADRDAPTVVGTQALADAVVDQLR